MVDDTMVAVKNTLLIAVIEDVPQDNEDMIELLYEMLNNDFREIDSEIEIKAFYSKKDYENFTFNYRSLIFIADIKLGRNDRGGIEIIQHNLQFHPKAKHIVHTGFSGYRTECVDELKVDAFITKGRSSAVEVVKKTKEILQSVFYPDKKESSDPGDELSEAEHCDAYVTLDDNFIKNLESLSFSSKYAIASMLANPMPEGHTFYAVNGCLFSVNLIIDTPLKKDSANIVAYQFDEDDRIIALQLSWDERLIEISAPDLPRLKARLNEYLSLISAKKWYGSLILEYWLSMKLAGFYLNEHHSQRGIPATNAGYIAIENNKKEILDMVARLGKEMGQFNFMLCLWEYFTGKLTKNPSITNEALNDVYERLSIDIEDIFYCKIEKRDEERGVCLIRLMSIEDKSGFSYKYFNTDTLKKYGLGHEADRFKLILYSVQMPGSAFFMLPVPPNVKFYQ